MSVKIGIATRPFVFSFENSFNQKIDIIGEKIFDDDFRKDSIGDYDLIIFSGGEDINPKIYSQRNKYSVGVNDHRDKIEQEVFKVSNAFNLALFGVCRGHQLINALMGGKLHQDIYRCLGRSHSSPHSINKTDKFRDKFLEGIATVNSLHHQGVHKIGMGLNITSTFNNVVETTIGKNIYTTQFHPEFMCDSRNIKNFFEKILEWAEKNKENKRTYKEMSMKLGMRLKRPVHWYEPDSSSSTDTITLDDSNTMRSPSRGTYHFTSESGAISLSESPPVSEPISFSESTEEELSPNFFNTVSIWGDLIYFIFNSSPIREAGLTGRYTYPHLVELKTSILQRIRDYANRIDELENQLTLSTFQRRQLEGARNSSERDDLFLSAINQAITWVINILNVSIGDEDIIDTLEHGAEVTFIISSSGYIQEIER